VTADDTITCTFTNTKQGAIKIVKDAVPNDDDFSFVRSFPAANTAFSLDDDGDNGNTLSNTFTTGSLAAGATYTVSENGETGWDLTNIVCSDDGGGALDSTVTIGASGGFDAGDTGVSIVLAAGRR
jgi:hypothetical protein